MSYSGGCRFCDNVYATTPEREQHERDVHPAELHEYNKKRAEETK